MKRLACLLFLGTALALPALAKVAGVPDTVAVVAPPASTVRSAPAGCTPISPCAVVTPALSDAALPAPQAPPQPDLSADVPITAPAAGGVAPTTPAPRAAAAGSPANCPPVGGRGEFAGRGRGGEGGRGDFAGRFGQGRGEAGRGGQQFAQGGAPRGGRGPDGCPPAGLAAQGRRGGNSGANAGAAGAR